LTFSKNYKKIEDGTLKKTKENGSVENMNLKGMYTRYSGNAAEDDPNLEPNYDGVKYGGYKDSEGIVQVSDLQNNAF
jgi:hypothetical protein